MDVKWLELEAATSSSAYWELYLFSTIPLHWRDSWTLETTIERLLYIFQFAVDVARVMAWYVMIETSRGSSVGIPAAGVRFAAGVREESFSSPQCPHRLWGPLSLLSNGHQRLFPWEVKRPGGEADHISPSSAEVKSGGAISPPHHMSSWHGN
jgi:hypothetical protein